MAARDKRGSQKAGNSLVALGSAAVLTVYAAGYLRTRPAAQRLEVAEIRTQAARAAAGVASPGRGTADAQPTITPAPIATPPRVAAAVPRASSPTPATPTTALPRTPSASPEPQAALPIETSETPPPATVVFDEPSA